MVTLREADERDAPGIAQLFAEVFARPISVEELTRKYARSWDGSIFVVEDEGRIVAHIAGIPRRLRVDQQTLGAVIAVDAMSAATHRVRFFGRLVERARAAWAAKGNVVSLGLPGTEALTRVLRMRPMLELERWQAHLSVSPMLNKRIGGTGAALESVLDPGWRVLRSVLTPRSSTPLEVIDAGSAEIDQLGTVATDRIHLARTEGWIRARFGEGAGRSYRVLGVRHSTGALAGYGVFRDPERIGGAAVLADLWSPDPKITEQLLSSILARAVAAGACRVELHIRTTQIAAVMRAGFWVKRAGAPVEASALVPSAEALLESPERWYFTGGDFDLV